MAEIERGVVIGVFEDRRAVLQAIDALLKAGFHEHQLGFAARSHEEHIRQIHQEGSRPNSLLRGVVGGLLGVADMLLVPITGPAEATSILANVLPVTEEAIDHLPYPGSREDAEMPTRPDAAMTMPAAPAQTGQPQESATPVVASDTSQAAEYAAAQPTTHDTEAPTRTGIITGGIVGGVLGAAAALLLPGIGPFVAGGVLAGIFGGGAIGGVAGGFLGAFTGMGVPAEQAHYYEREIKAGRTILTVHTTERQQEVSAILTQNGAHDVQIHG